MSSGQTQFLYRLKGLPGSDAEAHVAYLKSGANVVGTADTCEIQISAKGISRSHARLLVADDAVEVVDLDSKNGTFLDGRRIRRASVPNEARLRLGKTELILERVDADDVELAVTIDTAHAAPTDRTATATASITSMSGGAEHLDFLEQLMATASEPETGIARSLSMFNAWTGAGPSWLLECTDPAAEPVLIASSGAVELEAIEPLKAVTARARRRGIAKSYCETGVLEASSPVAFAVLSKPASPVLVLAARAPSTGEIPAQLLLLMLRTADLALGKRLDSTTGAPAVAAQLVFPEGHEPGVSPQMQQLYHQLRLLVDSSLPILIEGETGVGKEHIAQLLHLSSKRAAAGFVAVNCAAIPDDLLEAEMFGIEHGAATGVTGREGLMAQANGGTLFLDEIGELPPALQSKLLRALQEKKYRSVGASKMREVDLRVVAATNADLASKIEDGRFRADLYYRIAGARLEVAPLRRRREDLPVLAEAFVRRFAAETKKNVRGLTVKALARLVDYSWPGNVRELEHELRRLVELCPDSQAIDSSQLSPHIAIAPPPRPDVAQPGSSLRLSRHVDEVERYLIQQALSETDGSQRQAAKLLGISRNALARKIHRLGLPVS